MLASDEKIWLWKEMQCGNENALYQLYLERYDHLFRYGLHLLNDRSIVMACINETFAEIWEKRSRLPAVKNIDGYLFIIFKRKIGRQVQQKQPVYSLPHEELATLSAEDVSYEELLIAAQSAVEQKSRIQQALSTLTSRQKELICMKYYEELSMEEISDRLSISLRTIYNTLHTAITILRKTLRKE